MHISSLPSPYGIGTLGQAARDFIDFLADSGQSYWQILPICPTGFGDSPYQSFSSFAGNPYFIDLDDLADEGLLDREICRAVTWSTDELRVNYGILNDYRIGILNSAADRIIAQASEEFEMFCEANEFWLEDYSIFMTLKSLHGGSSWTDWDDRYRLYDDDEIGEFARTNKAETDRWKAIQFLFFRQWKSLRNYADQKDIRIIGDIPIYVSLDSADVWAHPEMFQLDEDRRPVDVSGCPPDGFSDEGQLWGNPLFDWDRMKADGYRWWISRISYLAGIYHILRIDHFRGFDSYYAIPFGSDDARNGEWREGPGIELFRAVEKAIGKPHIIAEDLGFLTPSVKKLRAETGFPGMKVLEMAFDHRDPVGSDYLPENFIPDCVVYIGTHDNDTAIGWLESAPEEDVALAREYLGLDDPDNYNWDMMRTIWRSIADTTIVQAQDLLGLGSEARMNRPSVPSGNWQWRAGKGAFTGTLAYKLRNEMIKYNRCRH